jgi:hypothetical protein
MLKPQRKVNIKHKKSLKWETLIIFSFWVVSCGNPNHILELSMKNDAEFLSELQCRAKTLQQKRFKLAERKFLLDDTLLILKENPFIQDSIRQEIELIMKEGALLQAETGLLADSIQSILSHWWKNEYRDTAIRRRLDIVLDSTFRAKCP